MDNIAETLERAKGGDTAAFAKIVRKNQSLISGILFSETGDFHKSEDLAQETFLVAWKKLGQLREDENLAAWLCTIARNLTRRSYRKQQPKTTDESAAEKISPEPGPETELLRREQSELVWSAIGEIPETYRETLVLYYRSGQSVKEIAEATALSEETVRQRLVRARKSLKSKLETIIGNILTDTAPGEVFTNGVIAAVSGAAFLTAGQTVLAAGTIAETAAASTMGTSTAGTLAFGTGSGTAGKSIGFTTFWSVLGPLGYFVWMLLLFWNSCYLSVRNAPTIRARRFRVCAVFRCFQFIGLFIVSTTIPFALYLYHVAKDEITLFSLVVFILVLYLLIFPAIILSYMRYRKIVEFDLGLSKIPGPFPGLSDIYSQFYRAFFINILWAETFLFFFIYISLFERFGMVYSWGEQWRFHLVLTVAVMLGLLFAFFFACFRLGKHLIGLTSSQESMETAPPVIENPFEVALGMVGKSILSVDRKEGNVFRINLIAWAAFGIAILWFIVSFVNWRIAPIPTGLCFLTIFVPGVFLSRVYKKLKDRKKLHCINIAYFLACSILSILILAIQSRSGSPAELWNVICHGYENFALYLSLGTMSFMFFVLALIRIATYILGNRKTPEDEQLRKEAIANYRPVVSGSEISETETAAKRPGVSKWLPGICVIYGCSIFAFIAYQLIFPNPMVSINILLGKDDYDALIRLEPENGDNYARRAWDRRIDDPLGAMDDLNMAIRLNPDDARSYRERAKLRLGFDHVGMIYDTERKTALNSKKTTSPSREEVLNVLSDADEAIRCDSKSYEGWIIRARADELLGNYDSATDDMRKAIRYYKAPVRVFEKIGRRIDDRGYMRMGIVDFLEKKGDLHGAIAECTKALDWLEEDAFSKDVFSDDFHRRRGELYEKIGEHEKAKADFEKIR